MTLGDTWSYLVYRNTATVLCHSALPQCLTAVPCRSALPHCLATLTYHSDLPQYLARLGRCLFIFLAGFFDMAMPPLTTWRAVGRKLAFNLLFVLVTIVLALAMGRSAAHVWLLEVTLTATAFIILGMRFLLNIYLPYYLPYYLPSYDLTSCAQDLLTYRMICLPAVCLACAHSAPPWALCATRYIIGAVSLILYIFAVSSDLLGCAS